MNVVSGDLTYFQAVSYTFRCATVRLGARCKWLVGKSIVLGESGSWQLLPTRSESNRCNCFIFKISDTVITKPGVIGEEGEEDGVVYKATLLTFTQFIQLE